MVLSCCNITSSIVKDQDHLRSLMIDKQTHLPHLDAAHSHEQYQDIKHISCKELRLYNVTLFMIFSGADRARTGDLRLAKPSFSQLNYSPRKSLTPCS